jgi:hypothetical protein
MCDRLIRRQLNYQFARSLIRPLRVAKRNLDSFQTIFDKAAGSKGGLAGNVLVVRQESGASVQLDAQVDLVLQLPAPRVSGAYMGTLIQQDFEVLAALGLGYAAWLFDRVDPTQRLSHIVPAATVLGASYQTWRTRAQQ